MPYSHGREKGLRARLHSNPEELLLACVMVLIGGFYLVGEAKPPSVTSYVPRMFVVVWGLELLVGGLLVIIGMFQRGFRLEATGLVVLCFATPIYALVIIAYAGWAGAFASAFLLGYSWACWARARSLMALVRAARIVGGSD